MDKKTNNKIKSSPLEKEQEKTYLFIIKIALYLIFLRVVFFIAKGEFNQLFVWPEIMQFVDLLLILLIWLSHKTKKFFSNMILGAIFLFGIIPDFLKLVIDNPYWLWIKAIIGLICILGIYFLFLMLVGMPYRFIKKQKT